MFIHLIAVAAILYAFYGVANLFSQGDSSGGIGAVLIGVGGVLMFISSILFGFVAIGLGIGITFLGPKNV